MISGLVAPTRSDVDDLEESHLDRWVVSYADFISLLFAFFVVMYAVSSVNDGKFYYKVINNRLVY